MADALDASEFLAGYLAEVEEHLVSANRNLLAIDENLKRGQSHPRAVRDLFRSLHTIKGLSGMVGVEPVVGLAHAMEAVLRNADRAGGKVPEGSVELLLRGLTAIEQRVAAVAHKRTVASPPAALLAELAGMDLGFAAPSGLPLASLLDPDLAEKLSATDREQLAVGLQQGQRAMCIEFMPTAARAAAGHTITAMRERVARVGEIVKVIPRSLPATDQAPGGLAFLILIVTDATDAQLGHAVEGAEAVVTPLALGSPAPSPGSPEWQVRTDEAELEVEPGADAARASIVRVDVARLDDAMEKLSALVVNRFRLLRALVTLREQGADVRPLAEIVGESGRQLKNLRASILRTRMIPVAELLERIPLLVRGLTASNGKRVRVRVDAGAAELDKAVAERIFPAIVHLVRNAVDHAIEPPEVREAAGKPAEGLIEVTCFERGTNQLELAIRDDGAGVDRDKVARRAGRELPASNEGLLALLTISGLSTADRSTTTSGRGMGMDIVKRIAVDGLGGELSLDTTAGRGTQFTLRIPLTITIQDAFSFRCGGQVFVVPVSMVEEIIEIDPGALVTGAAFRASGRQVQLIERRGTALPLVALDALLGVTPHPQAVRKAIVVRRNGEPMAFEVDQMLAQQDVVMRPLEDPLVRVPGVIGATDLGDGRPTLMLDLVSLAGLVGAPAGELPA